VTDAGWCVVGFRIVDVKFLRVSSAQGKLMVFGDIPSLLYHNANH